MQRHGIYKRKYPNRPDEGGGEQPEFGKLLPKADPMCEQLRQHERYHQKGYCSGITAVPQKEVAEAEVRERRVDDQLRHPYENYQSEIDQAKQHRWSSFENNLRKLHMFCNKHKQSQAIFFFF